MKVCHRAVYAGVVPESPDGLLRAAGFEPAGRATGAGEALALLDRVRPDLVLAEAVLPGLDGPALAEAILALPLRVRPAVLLIAPRGMETPGAEKLAGLNAALLEAPVSPEDLAAGFAEIEARGPALPPETAARLTALLDALGVPAHPGRRTLETAVALAWQDGRRLGALKQALYPRAAALCGLSAAQAERAMRYAIDAAWRSGAVDAQERIFGDTIDARRGRPTCGEMIARLADILRWEGRL